MQNETKKSNIILIGMSGAGKSTVGVLLAKVLGMSFTDTDLLLQEREGMLLQQIIERSGNDYFLAAEEKTVLSLDTRCSVIATGGSVVYSEKAMRHLKENGTVIYLCTGIDELRRRLKDFSSRGIVFKNAASLEGVLSQRLPLYEKYADITEYCEEKDAASTVKSILDALKD